MDICTDKANLRKAVFLEVFSQAMWPSQNEVGQLFLHRRDLFSVSVQEDPTTQGFEKLDELFSGSKPGSGFCCLGKPAASRE